MIVFGEKNIELLRERLPDKCPHCNMENSITMCVFQEVAHIFWIPLVPSHKTGISQCSHCKQVLELKEMPFALTNAYENLESKVKAPIWTYTGLALIAIGVIISVLVNINEWQEKLYNFIRFFETESR